MGNMGIYSSRKFYQLTGQTALGAADTLRPIGVLDEDDTIAINAIPTFTESVTFTLAGTENINIANSTLEGGTKGVYIEMEAGNVAIACRQGALHVELGRSTTMTASDGNPDVAVKITNSDWQDGGAGYARVRGMDIKAQNDGDNGNSTVWINTIYATAECATGMANSGNMSVAEFNMKNNGTITGTNIGIIIQDESQGATTSNTFGLQIKTANYNLTREAAIDISSTNGSWTTGIAAASGNMTNLFSTFITNGPAVATADASGDVEGSIKILVAGTAKYLHYWPNPAS